MLVAAMPPHVADVLTHPVGEFDWSLVMHPEVLVCSFVLFLSGILCSAAGIGGGGVYVAVLMVVGLLSPHDAVPLSKGIVFFGAVITMVMNLARMGKSTASAARPAMIDFHTVRVVAPAALAGTYFGVLLNWHAEGHMIVVLLTVLLTFMTLMVARTAYEQHSAEDALEESQALAQEAGEDGQGQESNETEALLPRSESAVAGKASPEAYDTNDVLLSVGLLLVVVIGGVVRFHFKACELDIGGAGDGACGHWILQTFFGGQMSSWLRDPRATDLIRTAVIVVPMLSCVLVGGWAANVVRSRSGWSVSQIFTYQAMGLITGLFAGLVGVGGGLIFSPFFLLTGMDPAVAVATSSTCVLFTSSSTTLQYMFTDRVLMSLALVYGLVTTAASYIGTRLVHTLQDAFHGKKSYITSIVAVAIFASAVMSAGKLATMST